jgi:hypothetical protein
VKPMCTFEPRFLGQYKQAVQVLGWPVEVGLLGHAHRAARMTTMDTMNKVPLVTLAKEAIRQSWRAVRDAHRSERIVGYALLTDDGLETVGHVACSEEWLASCEEPGARFEPVEWPYAEGSEAFDQTRTLLAAGAPAVERDEERFGAHVAQSHAALVSALKELKEEGAIPAEVFLSVISTDPNERLRTLEAKAVRALNADVLVAGWKVGREA